MPAHYPQYRRSRNGRHCYRIEGPRAFTEVQLVGARAMIHRVRDAAYPEQVRIAEMIRMDEGRYTEMNAVDFERLLDLHTGR